MLCGDDAGSADYALTHSPERDYGVFRFLSKSSRDETLRPSVYRHILDSLPRGNAHPARCPGSLLVAMQILGAGAEYTFFDTDPASIDSIAVAAAGRPGPRGGSRRTLRGHRGVRRTRRCVHIDPFDPFGSGPLGGPSSVKLARMLGAAGKTVVYWYGYDEPDHRFWAWNEIEAPTPVKNGSRW